jgi:glycerophosphoryl diester phosphodiesterase
MSLVSHRGAGGIAFENSKDAIDLAKTFKPVFIEVDIHCTSDMVFVMYHGDIKQTYTGNRRPETYAALKLKIPTLLKLEELLANDNHQSAFMFDIKCADDIDDLITYLQHEGVPSSVGFTSPHEQALKKLKDAFPHSITLIAQKYQAGPVHAIELARDYGFSGISLNKWWLGPLPYFMCSHYKKQIMVYTIDNKFWIWWAQTFFPRILLCTNRPDLYRLVYPN